MKHVKRTQKTKNTNNRAPRLTPAEQQAQKEAQSRATETLNQLLGVEAADYAKSLTLTYNILSEAMAQGLPTSAVFTNAYEMLSLAAQQVRTLGFESARRLSKDDGQEAALADVDVMFADSDTWIADTVIKAQPAVPDLCTTLFAFDINPPNVVDRIFLSRLSPERLDLIRKIAQEEMRRLGASGDYAVQAFLAVPEAGFAGGVTLSLYRGAPTKPGVTLLVQGSTRVVEDVGAVRA